MTSFPSNSTTMSPFEDVICQYPLVAPDCTEVYRTKVETMYTLWKVVMLLGGIGTGAINMYVCYISYWRPNTALHKIATPLLLLASSSFILRGIDPNGYSGVLPYFLANLGLLLCTATILTISYLIAAAWASLVHSFGVRFYVPWFVSTLAIGATVITWLFISYILVMSSADPFAEYGDVFTAANIILVIIGILVCAALIYYGIQLDNIIRSASAAIHQTTRHSRSLSSAPESFQLPQGDVASVVSGSDKQGSERTPSLPSSIPSSLPSSNASSTVSSDRALTDSSLGLAPDLEANYHIVTSVGMRAKQSLWSVRRCFDRFKDRGTFSRMRRLVFFFAASFTVVVVQHTLRIVGYFKGERTTAWASYNACVIGNPTNYEEQCEATFDKGPSLIWQMTIMIMVTKLFCDTAVRASRQQKPNMSSSFSLVDHPFSTDSRSSPPTGRRVVGYGRKKKDKYGRGSAETPPHSQLTPQSQSGFEIYPPMPSVPDTEYVSVSYGGVLGIECTPPSSERIIAARM